MKYNQPFDQPSSPNAPYVDGNPSAGIQGSIVPAASIEYPQREIMAAIQAAGLVGTNSDLTQLLQMMKVMDVFNAFKAGSNGGNASQWSMACPPLPTMPPPKGTAVWFHPVYDSVAGGTVFSINGSPFAPVTNVDLSPVAIGDVVGTTWLLLFFDGVEWLMTAGSNRAGGYPMLYRNATWYVDERIGDDNLHDGTLPYVVAGTAQGPFRTIQRGVNETYKYNMNGYSQAIIVADGNYDGDVFLQQTNGQGVVVIQGNMSNPGNVSVTTNTFMGSGIASNNGTYVVQGMRFATGPTSYDGVACSHGTLIIQNCQFGPCGRFHISAQWAGTLSMNGPDYPIIIEAGGNCVSHICASLQGQLAVPTPGTYFPPLIINGPVTIQQFARAEAAGGLVVGYQNITGAAFVSGSKYLAQMNGYVSSFNQGPNYFPGSTAGSISTGGQYE